MDTAVIATCIISACRVFCSNKYKQSSYCCEIEDFVKNSSLHAVCGTSIDGVTGVCPHKGCRSVTPLEASLYHGYDHKCYSLRLQGEKSARTLDVLDTDGYK